MLLPGIINSLNLHPDPTLNYVEKITAVTTPGTVGTIVYDVGAANNFTFQFRVDNYTGGATYLGIYILAALDGVSYIPVNLPFGPATNGIFTEYTLGIDSFKVASAGNKSGTVILPNQYSMVKFGAYTDAGTADLYILRSSPSVS